MPGILIVDDEWLTRLEIEGMLTDLGYDVAGQAETGVEAIAMARELNPDLILMDVKMPGEMNGIDAAGVIKRELGIPIVFISGYGDPEYIEAAKEIAPFGYVMKPFDEREVHAFVEIALSRKELELKLDKSHKQLEQTNLDLQREIAARKQTETELRESRKLYRDIFEKNNAIKWLVDPSSGEIVDANPAACEFYQYTHEEITNLYVWDINVESEANVKALLSDASEEKNDAFTFKHRLASGEIRDVQVYTGTLESGGRTLLHSIILDITARKQAERKVRQAYAEVETKVEERTVELSAANVSLAARIAEHRRTEDKLHQERNRAQSYLDTVEAIIVALDLEGEITLVNQKGCLLLGRDEDELIGQSWFSSCIPQPEGMEERYPAFLKHIAGEVESLEYFEYPIIDGNGKLRQIAWNNKLLRDEQMEIVGTLSAGQDITRRRQAEEELAGKTKNLEELNAALNILLEKRMKDRENLEESVLSNVKTLISPYVKKLNNSKLTEEQQTFLNVLNSNLNEIVSPFTKRLSAKYLNLTPKEIRIANLVTQGKTNKEIAEMQGVAIRTIAGHRENIRKKLDLVNRKTNLRTFLHTLN